MKIRTAIFAVVGFVALGVLFTAVDAQPALDRANASPSDSKTTWDGVYTPEQADRGKAAYTEHCSACHGDDLAGQDQAPPLAGSQFMSNWNGLTVGDLAERVRNTMPMNNPGSLSKGSTVADILAYIFSYNKFPAGETELPSDTSVLKQIRIEATKPAQ